MISWEWRITPRRIEIIVLSSLLANTHEGKRAHFVSPEFLPGHRGEPMRLRYRHYSRRRARQLNNFGSERRKCSREIRNGLREYYGKTACQGVNSVALERDTQP